MVVYKDWGKHLRLGNFLFVYYSLLDIAKVTGHELVLPDWYMWQYMLHPPKIDTGIQEDELFPFRTYDYSREEKDWLYNYFAERKDKVININLGSNNQSELWFQDQEPYIKEMCAFKAEVIQQVKDKYSQVFTKPTIGIGIRRGDFVGHGVFYQIPEGWYERALTTCFPDWESYNIVIFSDDIDWCKQYFTGKPYLYAEPNGTHTHADNFKHYHNDPMEQFILGSLLDNFIGGSSTFTWWQMWYVSRVNGGTVVHSGKNLSDAGEREFGVNPNYYPADWICYHVNNL